MYSVFVYCVVKCFNKTWESAITRCHFRNNLFNLCFQTKTIVQMLNWEDNTSLSCSKSQKKTSWRQHISVVWFIHHVNILYPWTSVNNSEELKRNILQSQHTRHNHTKMIWPHVLRHLTVVFLTNLKIWQCFELLQQCKISGYTWIYITVQKLWVSEIFLWKITFIHKCCFF